MIEQPARVEQFQQEIESMQLRDPAVGRDRNLLRLGGILMVAGLVVAAYAFPYSNSDSSSQQSGAVVLGILGATLALVGGALFLRYSLAQFFRFWLARLSYEQQVAIDRIAGAAPAAAPGAVGAKR